MIGKFGERYATQVNMAWMWARLKARTTRLGTFKGGFQAFADQFASRLTEMGVQIRLSTPVNRIAPRPEGGLRWRPAAGSEIFDQCLVTTSPALLARLAPDLPAAYLQGLLGLKSMGAVVMVLALKQRLSEQGYYWYNIPKSAGFPVPGAGRAHQLCLARAFRRRAYRLYRRLPGDRPRVFPADSGRAARAFPALPDAHQPDFQPDWVRKTWLFRTTYAQPVPLVNHSQNIPSIQTPIPGLYFASMSQVYPWDRGTNFAVEICRRAARSILASLA